MNKLQIIFLAVVIPIGLLVPLSYILGIGDNADILWGGVPKNTRSIYVGSMLLGATSFFIFSAYIFFNLLKQDITLPFGLGSNIFTIIYGILLASSALWIPLVNSMVNNPKDITWLGVRAVLLLTALCSLCLLLIFIKLGGDSLHYKLSLIGLVIFLIHTGVLDAVIWPYLWKK